MRLRGHLSHGLHHVCVPGLHSLQHLAELDQRSLGGIPGLERANITKALRIPILNKPTELIDLRHKIKSACHILEQKNDKLRKNSKFFRTK
jgi:hypothetical protein